MSLLWRTRSLSQINVKARLKWHPTHVRERKGELWGSVCVRESDYRAVWRQICEVGRMLPAFVFAFDVDMDGFLRGTVNLSCWKDTQIPRSLFVLCFVPLSHPKSSVFDDTKKIRFLKIWTFNYSNIGEGI